LSETAIVFTSEIEQLEYFVFMLEVNCVAHHQRKLVKMDAFKEQEAKQIKQWTSPPLLPCRFVANHHVFRRRVVQLDAIRE
jgi:5'(3')-deoxyribonucleotidase